MILRRSMILLAILFLLFPTSTAAESSLEEAGWEVIVPGIEYQKFTLPDPNNVFVVRMDRSNQNLTIESSIAGGKLAEDRETVSGMYYRYDQALNYWGGSAIPPTWGMSNQVVVAINGSYFDWGSGTPQGGQVHSGWYAKRYDDMGGWSGFAWKLDRSAFIGECVYHQPTNQFVYYPTTGKTQRVGDVNGTRELNELVLYTPQYNSQTGTDDLGVEVLVEMTRPTMILPEPAYASGKVRQIRENKGNSLIPFNYVVLSGSGTSAESLVENAHVGDEVRISQEITSYRNDCSTAYPLSWTKAYASIQGAFFFLRNGEIHDFDDPGATNRHPRTAIGYNDQFIFFIVVDGRDLLHSVGMTINELALFTRDTLGATWAVAQDGGGSSTMVIDGNVINNTFCNIHSCSGQYKTYLPMVTQKTQNGESVNVNLRGVYSTASGIERAVANGMMMVVTQPADYSQVFQEGDTVRTIVETGMRLGPGTNYAEFIIIPVGTTGTILDQMNDLNGVLAKSTHWWYVEFGEVRGWVQEEKLSHQEAAGDFPIAR